MTRVMRRQSSPWGWLLTAVVATGIGYLAWHMSPDLVGYMKIRSR